MRFVSESANQGGTVRLSPNEVAWLALKIGLWTPVDAVTGTAIAFAESGYDVDAMNV